MLLVVNLASILHGLTTPFLSALSGPRLPTLFTAPLAFLTVIGVSLLDRRNMPPHVDEIWLRLHGTAQERQERLLKRLRALAA